jgi:hypothetical protein
MFSRRRFIATLGAAAGSADPSDLLRLDEAMIESAGALHGRCVRQRTVGVGPNGYNTGRWVRSCFPEAASDLYLSSESSLVFMKAERKRPATTR